MLSHKKLTTDGFSLVDDGRYIALMNPAFPDKEANARRLVACWNEHDDLVHDNARLYQSLQGEMQGRLKAEQERDEALAAFSDLYTEVMVEFGYCPDPVKFEAILAKHQKVTG